MPFSRHGSDTGVSIGISSTNYSDIGIHDDLVRQAYDGAGEPKDLRVLPAVTLTCTAPRGETRPLA